MKKRIKLFDPYFDNREKNAINNILKSGFWASGSGTNKVLEFEKKFKRYIGTDECITTNSGTASLHLALSLYGIKNKKVILPSLSFVSTAHAVIYNGGIPIFVDVDEETLCLNSDQVDEHLSEQTSVILPVHFAGMPANLQKLSKLCKKNKLILIEDAAHAAGSSYKGKKIGSHGDAVCFSFHPVKNLAMPTGGAITLNGIKSNKSSNDLKSLRWCGISNRKDHNYDVKILGWNYYMNEFSAAIGIEQLQKLEKLNKKRKNIAKRYSQEINLIKKMPYSEDCSYHFYWIQVDKREKFMKNMSEYGIETGIHYNPIHQMSYYASTKTSLPLTEQIGKQIVSLPTHPNMTEEDVSRVIKSTNEISSK